MGMSFGFGPFRIYSRRKRKTPRCPNCFKHTSNGATCTKCRAKAQKDADERQPVIMDGLAYIEDKSKDPEERRKKCKTIIKNARALKLYSGVTIDFNGTTMNEIIRTVKEEKRLITREILDNYSEKKKKEREAKK